MKVIEMSGNITMVFNESREIYRYLHQHPELSFEEYQTRAFILNQLLEYGYEEIGRASCRERV